MEEYAARIGYLIGVMIVLFWLDIPFDILLYRLAKRLRLSSAWWAFVPVLQFLLIIRVAGWRWPYNLIIGTCLILVWPLGLVFVALAFADLADNIGRPRWQGYISAVPIVWYVGLWLLGSPVDRTVPDRDYRLRANHEDDLSTRLYAGEAAGAYAPTLSQAVGPPSQVTPALQDTMVDFGGLSGTGETGGESRLKSLEKCPNCNSANRDGAMFCNHCGEPLFAEGGPLDLGPRAPGPADPYAPGQAAAPVLPPVGWPPQAPGQYYPRDISDRNAPASSRRKGVYSGTVGAVLIGCVIVGLLAFAVISFMKPGLKAGPPPGWRNATSDEWDTIDGQMKGRLDAESLFVPETTNQYVNTIIVVKVVALPGMPEVPDTGDLEVMKAYVNDHRGDVRLGEEFCDVGASERIESVEAVQMDCGQCALLVRSWTTYAEMKVVEDVIIVRKGSKTYGVITANVVGANNDLEVTHLLKNIRFE